MISEVRKIPLAELFHTRSMAHAWFSDPGSVKDLLPPSLDQLGQIIEQRRPIFQNPEYRERLRNHFEVTNAFFGAPPSARDSAARLSSPDVFLIVTGQQAGLLGGPLYTLLKVATAIGIARKLCEERNETFIPCFWCASEDTDFSEVRSLILPPVDGDEPVTFSLEDYPLSDTPVNSIPASHASLDDLISFLQNNLRETEFTPGWLQSIRQTYSRSKDLAGWMIRFLWEIFPEAGLLITAPLDGFYQRESRKVLQAELSEPLKTSAQIRQAAMDIVRRGLHPQLHKPEGLCSFFIVESRSDLHDAPLSSIRLRTEYDEERERFLLGNTEAPRENLMRRLEVEPHAFSANAVLRPVCQDAAFPTMVNILGPGEIGYHAELREVYARHGIPRPAFMPRLSVTVLPSRTARFLDQYSLSLMDLRQDVGALIRRIVQERMEDGPEKIARELLSSIGISFQELIDLAREKDPSMVPSLNKEHRGLVRKINRIVSRFEKHEGQKEIQLSAKIRSLQLKVFPSGKPAERYYNSLFYLNSYGPDLISHLIQEAQKLDSDHLLLFL